MGDRHAQLTTAMLGAGCIAPKDWVHSELSENIPQFARFLLLRDVHRAADAVDTVLADTVGEQPHLQATLDALREAVGEDALHTLLQAYGKALGNALVMVLDEGPADASAEQPGWALMETDADGVPTGRWVQGLHEDYLDFDGAYQPAD